MANYLEIGRRFPAVRHYVRHRRWLQRGEVAAYAPGIEGGAFSTDAYGFRHGEMNGIRHDLAAAFGGLPYAIVLGSSHLFGFGLESNAQTIPSRLSALLGLACLNISFPEADLRTLHATCLRITSQAPRPPAFICCFVGGTFTRYCYTRRCDPLFGAPDLRSAGAGDPPGGSPAEARAFANLQTYARFWLDQLHGIAQARGCSLLMHPEFTAFEKPVLSECEAACGLTLASNPAQEQRFDTHRLRYAAFRAAMTDWMREHALVAMMEPNGLSFIDEFHYTPEASERIAACLAERFAAAHDGG